MKRRNPTNEKISGATFPFRRLFVIITAGALCATLLGCKVQCQERPSKTAMKKSELAEAAAVLKALTKGWALVDYHPDIKFLVFVDENREELDFYPQKSFVQMMERTGLIENLDKEGSSRREPYTHFEGDFSAGGWKEITEAGTIVFQYKVTPKGERLLRDAPKLLKAPLRRLRIAGTPAEIDQKPLKVVTYDSQAIQRMVDAFVQQGKTQVEAALTPRSATDLSAFSPGGLLCGPKLWQKLEPSAARNGLRPHSIITHDYNLLDERLPRVTQLKEKAFSSPDAVRLFWQTLHETIKLDGPPVVRRVEASEASAYLLHDQFEHDDLPPSPDLSEMTLVFSVESNKHRFIVVVKSEMQADMKHFGPGINWIELVNTANHHN